MSNASNRSRLALDMRFYAILSHIFPQRFSRKVALIACFGYRNSMGQSNDVSHTIVGSIRTILD